MAGRYDFDLVAGTTFARMLTWLSDGFPVDLTGYSAHMQVRSWPDGALLGDLSSMGGQITLGGPAGTIALSLPSSATAALPAGTAKYDLLMTSGSGSTSELLYGDVIIRAAVTHS